MGVNVGNGYLPYFIIYISHHVIEMIYLGRWLDSSFKDRESDPIRE